ncbi:hypothetical protein K461DRAFT_295756 [Myriangium duriaei CBS 260.36]|uniref:Kinetochore protein Sos7 coiled-coil domain-containing protein n=1 Tax=Myriangium duriaei CBS 260.36 TaxID=1168546 RepID=A0A9P4MK65_9PEZI|nr:hypothetical protein K461DRAFT_295756 [Myriangium duriaei CBS 260.36]
MATTQLHTAHAALSSPPPLSIHTLAAHPTSSAAQDLEHYKSLFSKLRFSYTEQVTKERFLKSLVADPPELPTPSSAHDLALLETKLASDKAALKQKKASVAAQLDSLNVRGREVAGEHESLAEPMATLLGLPEELAELEARVEELRAVHPVRSGNPLLNHGLETTRELLAERQDEAAALEAEIVAVRAALEARADDVQRLRGEVNGAEERKREAVGEVMEIRRRKGNGGWDEEERKARWIRAQKGVLEGLVG